MKKNIFIFCLIGLILLATKTWFSSSLLVGGDLLYQSQNTYQNFSVMPYAWSLFRGEGLGGAYIPFLWNNIITTIPIGLLGGYFGIPWNWLEKLLFFYPFLILAFFSSYYLARRLIRSSIFQFFAPFIFILNTYIIMTTSGGQMQIALAYAIAPFIIGKYIESFNTFFKTKQLVIKSQIVIGLLLSLQIAMDTRVVFITLFAIFFYTLFFTEYKLVKKSFIFIKQFVLFIVIPFVVPVLLHAFWIVPLILYGRNPVEQLGTAYSGVDAVRFFSFAKLENSLSLLHPNWPENIFGVTHFMKAEFLMLPVIAFMSLLFINSHKVNSTERRLVIYFSFLALIGAFLAKGATEPLGEIYIWLYSNVPGFSLFRDPIKWYILVAISYSVLIPFTLNALYTVFAKNKFTKKFHLQKISFALTLLLFLYLLKPVITGEIGGTFRESIVPNDYKKLEQLLVSEKNFSRTFWIPVTQRYGFYSEQHPQMSGQGTFVVSSTSAVLENLKEIDAKLFFEESAIKYVIVPYDKAGEIFVDDHKYDDKKFQEAVKKVATLSALKRVQGFEKLVVFENETHKDHFFIASSSAKIQYTYKNPTEYEVTISHAKKGERLIFSESYDRFWIASSNSEDEQLHSEKYHKFYNSFVLPRDGNYSLTVLYKPQEWVNLGLAISIVSFIVIISLLLYRKKK